MVVEHNGKDIKQKNAMDWGVGGKYCGCYPPHEFYLGTCTCIFRKIKPRGVGVGVEYGGCEGVVCEV